MKKSRLKEIILEEIANVMANPLTEGVGDKILKAIPDGYHYKKLAADIASIVKVEFGSHNIKPFMKELTSLLRESIKLSEGTSKFVVYVGTKTNPTVHAVVDSKSKADAMDINDILPYLSSLIIVLSNIFTFYFAKKTESGNNDKSRTESDG